MTSKEELLKQLSEAGMSEIAFDLAELGREAFRLGTSATADRELPLGASKLGGLPDLPADTPWPDDGNTPLSFVGQINLAEAPSPSILPKDGLLSFFYDTEQRAWGFDPNHRGLFRVFYSAASSQLHRARNPRQEDRPSFLSSVGAVFGKSPKSSFPTFTARRLSFLSFLSLPDPGAKVIEDLLLGLENDEMYADFLEEYFRPGPVHQLLG